MKCKVSILFSLKNVKIFLLKRLLLILNVYLKMCDLVGIHVFSEYRCKPTRSIRLLNYFIMSFKLSYIFILLHATRGFFLFLI